MFTGIVEAVGTVVNIQPDRNNVRFTIQTDLAQEAYIDQSIAHNGVCLTVVSIDTDAYVVTAIQETMDKTNLSQWKVGDPINLERAVVSGQRLDGHMVQGHVDGTVELLSIADAQGSWNYRFHLSAAHHTLIVNKGSVCLNGISLTVVDPDKDSFGVSIIPYTYEHTNMKQLQTGDLVNIEYDMIAKHVAKHIDAYLQVHLPDRK